jgi:hypothetical protein
MEKQELNRLLKAAADALEDRSNLSDREYVNLIEELREETDWGEETPVGFTPGEWNWERDFTGELAIWDAEDRNLLVGESPLPCAEREANAALMSAAPRLHNQLIQLAHKVIRASDMEIQLVVRDFKELFILANESLELANAYFPRQGPLDPDDED